LEVPSNSTLVFSYVGFVSEEVQISNQSVINLSLTPDLTQLEEIVVIGYGSVKKSDLTGSVSSVKSEDLTAYPAIGAVQALQGRAAGVQVLANNGEPGSSYKVRVRGGTSINSSSDPLYVVDGFPGATLPPPEDIQSIEVLKDASATAIYGSRGANGVIMVTTKRGDTGKAQINFNASFTSQKEINRLDLLDGQQFADMMNELTPGREPDGGANTDWQDEIFQTGNIQNYQLSVGGGNENVKYYISGTVYDQKGIIANSGYKRYSINSNLDIKASKNLSVGMNIFARRTNKNGVLTQENSGGTTSAGVTASAFKFAPTQGIYKDDGSFTLSAYGDPHDNPVAIATQRTIDDLNDRLQSTIYGEYSFFEDLKLRVTLGGSINNRREGQYVPTTLNAGANSGGAGSINSWKNTDLINENYLTYSKDFGDHDLTVMGGYSYQSFSDEYWMARSQSFISDGGLYWDLDGGAVVQAPSSSLVESELQSFYGRLNYTLFDRILFTFNARYDGSSRFAKNNKWAFFPSGALAWNIAEESFMSNMEKVDLLKIRVSYGQTGNQAIAPYQSLAKFGIVNSAAINNSVVNAVRPTSVANDNLTWETTTQFDLGVDVSLFGDRLGFTADYYNMITDDLLFSLPLPEYSGFSSQLANIGSVENKGFEFTLNTKPIVGEFQWDMDFNISANKNEILELPENDNPGNWIIYNSVPGHMVGADNAQILMEGQPVGSFYGLIYDGVYQEGDDFLSGSGFEQIAGGEKFRDIDGTRDDDGNLTGVPDGQLNNDDRAVIGNPHPDFIWGWNNEFRWKGFDLNIFFQGSQGNDMYNYTLMELDILSGRNNATKAALNRWTPTNTDTDIPVLNTGRARKSSTRWIEDGSFIRLKNIALGYNIPGSILEKAKIRSLRVYVSAQNLLTITDYKGYDPEVNYRSSGGSDANRNLGLDYGSYPNAKGFTAGINLGF
jgi:TonB-linked SusC/RagA family outer membrane protein